MSAELDSLVAKFRRSRSEDDFRRLHRRAGPRLFRLALRLTRWQRQEAEDLVQETWLRACRGLERFRQEASFTTWLGSIAVNVHRERLRRKRPESDRETAPEPTVEPADPAIVDLERGIARLATRARQVLVLHDIEGWTHRQIAAALDIAEGTSKSQLHVARLRLRQSMQAGSTSAQRKQAHPAPNNPIARAGRGR